MKIGIDGLPLTIPFPCGTKHYAEQLLFNLAKIDKQNEYIIFSKKNIAIPQQKNFRLIKIPTYIPVLKRQLFLSYFAKKEKVDIFHYLEPIGSIFINNLNIVTTVHDFDLKKIYPKKNYLKYHSHMFYASFLRDATLKNTNTFIAVSKYTKYQLSRYLKNKKLNKDIKVIYEAPHSRFRTLKYLKKQSPYFLCMGDFSPRKNIPKVIEAFSLLPKEVLGSHTLKIIISSKIPEQIFLDLSRHFRIENKIQIITAPSLTELINLYNLATAFLYPSLYEGFGLPILEAMACSCPVITSNTGSTKEIAGGAALLVNPDSAIQISKAILKIAKDRNYSNSLEKKGLKRVNDFSWLKTANQTLSVYKNIYDILPALKGGVSSERE